MCGARRRERQAFAMQAYQSYLTNVSRTQEQAYLTSANAQEQAYHTSQRAQEQAYLISQDAGHQRSQPHAPYGTIIPSQPSQPSMPPMPYGRYGRRQCCGRSRRERSGPITFVVKSIIKAVENKREHKAQEQERIAQRERETQENGVVERNIEKNEEAEEEWEQVNGVVGQDIVQREAPPSYEKAVSKAWGLIGDYLMIYDVSSARSLLCFVFGRERRIILILCMYK